MRENYNDVRREFTRNLNLGGIYDKHRTNLSQVRKEFNSTLFSNEFINHYRSDYGLNFSLFLLDDFLYASYINLINAATNLCSCIKTFRKYLLTAKLFRKCWYICHLPSDTI